MTDTVEAAAPRTTKTDAVIKLLSRSRGASVAEIGTATDWQPHSVRSFLTGLRKKGRAIAKEERRNGETSYKLTA